MALLQKAYLGATPLFRNEDWFEDSSPIQADAASGVTVTANSSAHTKGSWTQLIASTSANSSFLFMLVGGIGAVSTNTATLLDIGTGASGSETAIASNIAVGGASTFGGISSGIMLGLPLKIPAGTRISARIQSVVTGGKTATVTPILLDAGDYATAPTSVDVIGTDAATSKGTEFSGASGTWVQGIASTTQAYRAVVVAVSGHDSVLANTTGEYAVGVGASGAEIEFGSFRANTSTNEFVGNVPPYIYLFGRNIPAGSRLAVKHNIAADPSKYGFCLIGIP